MSMLLMSAESLGQQVGGVVPEIYLTIAKNSIVGLDRHGISEILGVSVAEIQEVEADPIYKDVRLLLAAAHSQTQLESDFNWDEIESIAVKGLVKRIPHERDTETLLKIAAVANKAVRRNNPNQNKVLDPAQGVTRVPLTLTSRIVERLARDGSKTVETTKQISVLDGSAVNPKFEDIDGLFGVSQRQAPGKMTIQTRDGDFTVDDLEYKG